ncbi:MAG: Rrf2 family transcriptional regulator [Candidatus Margulisbacteria bacterium]|nr:Rrf2 family transcriptional regulator [Candidatus Margulisiibacteriota bacterium]
MRFTKSCDFALRLLIALSADSRTSTMPDLSEKLGIPYHHLTKLVQLLGKANLIQTKQGKNGGIRMLKAPEEITLRYVTELTDGPIQLSKCLVDPTVCCLICSCKLKHTFRDLQDRMNALLDNVKLSEFV